MEHIRHAAAACQTDLANPVDRPETRRNTDRMLSMIDSAVAGSAPFLPVRLVVFPEFAHDVGGKRAADRSGQAGVRLREAEPTARRHTGLTRPPPHARITRS